jgi:hypothetical protein
MIYTDRLLAKFMFLFVVTLNFPEFRVVGTYMLKYKTKYLS